MAGTTVEGYSVFVYTLSTALAFLSILQGLSAGGEWGGVALPGPPGAGEDRKRREDPARPGLAPVQRRAGPDPRSALFSEMYPTAVGLGRMGTQPPSGAAMEKIFR